MDVKLLRIDSRLVHGQVANNWAGSLGAEAILAVSDGAANDELRKTLMLQTGGGKVKVHVLGVEKAARVYKNPSTRPSRRSSSSRPRPTSCACSTWAWRPRRSMSAA